MLNITSPINTPPITNKGREEDREVGIKETTNLKGVVNNPTPLITNKGREDDRDVGTKETTNLKEVANNPTLLTTTKPIPLHINPSIHPDLVRTLNYRLTICALFVTHMAIIHISVPI